jgi:hypothetical protein
LSQRKIAKVVGVDEKTIRNDLGADKSAENADNSALEIPLEAPRAGEKEILPAGSAVLVKRVKRGHKLRGFLHVVPPVRNALRSTLIRAYLRCLVLMRQMFSVRVFAFR